MGFLRNEQISLITIGNLQLFRILRITFDFPYLPQFGQSDTYERTAKSAQCGIHILHDTCYKDRDAKNDTNCNNRNTFYVISKIKITVNKIINTKTTNYIIIIITKIKITVYSRAGLNCIPIKIIIIVSKINI